MERPIDRSDPRRRLGHRLLQLGMAVFLFALLLGLVVPKFAVPRLGLSAHLLGITQGLFLSIAGLLWPRLRLRPPSAHAGSWLIAYGCLAPLTATALAGAWGAGNTLLPLAAGPAHGSGLEEGIIAFGLRSGAAALILSTVLILWGLRGGAEPENP